MPKTEFRPPESNYWKSFPKNLTTDFFYPVGKSLSAPRYSISENKIGFFFSKYLRFEWKFIVLVQTNYFACFVVEFIKWGRCLFRTILLITILENSETHSSPFILYAKLAMLLSSNRMCHDYLLNQQFCKLSL